MSRISKPASRVLALLMVVCMLIGMLPVSAFAAEGETLPITTVVEDGHDHDHDHEDIDDEQENIEDEEPVIEDEETVIDEEKLVIELESIEDQQEAVEAEVTPRAGEQIVEITTNKDKNSATEDISIAVGESFILKLKN